MNEYKNAGVPKLMVDVGHGWSLENGYKIERRVCAIKLTSDKYLVEIRDSVSLLTMTNPITAPTPPILTTAVLQASSIEELRAMFFDKEN